MEDILKKSAMVSVLAGLLLMPEGMAGEAVPVPSTNGAVFVEAPGAFPPEAIKRGSEFRVAGSPQTIERQPVIWAWRFLLPDGSGLAFGGRALRTDDPCVHTQVRQAGEWKEFIEELRKKNLLQASHDSLLALRRPLQLVTGLARASFFEGRDEASEKAFMEKEVAPKAGGLAGKLKEGRSALSKAGGSDAYAAAQAAFALGHLDKVLPAVEGLGLSTSHEKLAALRQARIELEQAIDALDAEPPARALSMLAYDEKTGLLAVFGGDHLDYLSNDLWTFDPKQAHWQQRHPKSAPEPRAHHWLEGDGAGKLKLRGGYVYGRRGMQGTYSHAGEDAWTYDLKGEAWQGSAEARAFTNAVREYRQGAFVPDFFTDGPRPDAAAHAKVLAGLPANAWVDLKPAKRFVWNRDWGTLAFDPGRDSIYWYTGGHGAYPGTDVAHYHLAVNSWDQPVETELPPGYIGSNEAMISWSFNRRPFMGHSYASYAYHPGLRKLIVNGRQTLNGKAHDANTYVYDPDYGDWLDRKPTPISFDRHGAKLRWVPEFGMITWNGDRVWKLDDAALTWSNLAVKGKVPGAICDHSGLTYDSRRNRVLFFSGGSYNGTPYSGEVFALAFPSLEMTSFKPEGSEHIEALTCLNAKGTKQDPAAVWVLREAAHQPDSDLFLFGSKLAGGYVAALDAKNNRWVGLKIPGPWPWGLSAALTYDAKRDLFFAVGTRADASALKLDPKTVEIKTFAEIAMEAAKAGAAVEKR